MLDQFTTDYLVIFEGPDGAGKTSTIANLGLQAHHTGGPPKTSREFMDRVESLPIAGILDRWPPISEYAYGPLRLEGPFFSLEDLCKIARKEETLRDGNIFVVFCRPPNEVLRENLSCQAPKGHKSNDHIELIKSHQSWILSKYDTIISEIEETLGIGVYHHDYTTDPHGFLLAYNLTHPSFGKNPIFKRKS